MFSRHFKKPCPFSWPSSQSRKKLARGTLRVQNQTVLFRAATIQDGSARVKITATRGCNVAGICPSLKEWEGDGRKGPASPRHLHVSLTGLWNADSTFPLGNVKSFGFCMWKWAKEVWVTSRAALRSLFAFLLCLKPGEWCLLPPLSLLSQGCLSLPFSILVHLSGEQQERSTHVRLTAHTAVEAAPWEALSRCL